jgi:hypothetical protein
MNMNVHLYAGDELNADISLQQDKIFFVINEETILDDRINFHQMLNAAINSCIRNTLLIPYIIYDGKHNDRIDSFIGRAGILDYPLSFAENIRRVLRKPNTSIAAMLKIEIPKILEMYKMNDEYVFFADADVLFTEKFTNPETKPEYYAASSEFELDQDIPNNTGFIVINVKGMRNTYEDFKRFVIENLEWLNQGVAWDQHYLNEYYLKRNLVTFLGREYNWKAYWPMNKEAKVVHFHGPKPTYKYKFMNNIPNDYDDTRFVFDLYDGVDGFASYFSWCEEWEKYLK